MDPRAGKVTIWGDADRNHCRRLPLPVSAVVEPDLWRVEDNDYNDDGGCTFTLFGGPDAEIRAREYAELLERIDSAGRA